MLWADEDVEFIEATYAPGGASGPGGALVRHGGREFGHVIRGTLPPRDAKRAGGGATPEGGEDLRP